MSQKGWRREQAEGGDLMFAIFAILFLVGMVALAVFAEWAHYRD